MLDISRVTRNKLQFRKERIQLAAAVNSAVEAVQPIIAASAHELTVNLPSDSIFLCADPFRLTQVFSNLLNNAAKYTGNGATSG